jgi:dUTPase
MNRFRFTKVRDVEAPKRSNVGDAGLDFYTPRDLTFDQLVTANKNAENIFVTKEATGYGMVLVETDPETGFITSLKLGPHARVLIPSGIRGLIEPQDSALIAANKSGKASKQSLLFTAEVIDSPYTGEIHIGICNTSSCSTDIELGSKLIQFIHTPIYLTTPEEISNSDYEAEAENWGTRGSDGFGSTDNN